MGFLEDFYYGRISIWDKSIHKDSKYALLFKEVVEKEKNLMTKFDSMPELKSLFKEYSDAVSDLYTQSDIEKFVDGFKLASKMFVEVFFQND